MILLLILGVPFGIATLLAAYGFRLRGSLAPTVRPSWGWSAALVVLVIADAVLVLAFWLAIAVYNCHGRYECPF